MLDDESEIVQEEQITSRRSRHKENLHKEELILNLDLCIDSLMVNVDNYKSIQNPNFSDKLEFMTEYTILEEKILNTFDQLNCIKISKNQEKRIEVLLGQFNQYWRDFQDEWTEELWKIYEEIRKNDKKLYFRNLEYIEEMEKMSKEQEESKNPEVEEEGVLKTKSSIKDTPNQTLNHELKEIMKRFRRNSTPGGRLSSRGGKFVHGGVPGNFNGNLNTLHTEDHLNMIDQELRMNTYDCAEKSKLIGGERRKDRGCFPVCCIIY